MNSTGEPTQRNGDSTSLTGRFVTPVTYRQANEKSSSPAGEPSTVRERSAAPGDQSQMTSRSKTGSPLATLLFGFGPAQASAERIAKA
jgi:hypothetical protein